MEGSSSFVGFAEKYLHDRGGQAARDLTELRDELPLTREEVDYLLDTGIIAGAERYNGRDRPPIREPACRHGYGAYVCAACHQGHYETTIAEVYLGRGYSDPPLDPGRVKAQITLLRRLARDSIERPLASAANAGGELTFEEFARQANAIARRFGARYLPFPGAEPACDFCRREVPCECGEGDCMCSCGRCQAPDDYGLAGEWPAWVDAELAGGA